MNIVGQVEKLFLPMLEEAAVAIRRESPPVRVTVFSNGSGALTGSPGHIVGLQCFFPDKPDYPDEVVLEITLGHLAAVPWIDADVMWGHPGFVEAEVFPSPVEASDAAVEAIRAAMPHLVEALKAAVRRGHPIVAT